MPAPPVNSVSAPTWPAPAIVRAPRPADVVTLVDALRRAAPPAIALVVLVDDAPDLPRDARTDPRLARPLLVAVAAPGLGAVHILEGAALAALAPLQALLAGDPAPYVVVADAHLTLGVLARHGVAPPRFGCTLTAATLLAEGADGRRDDRPLGDLVRAHLGHDLPGRIVRGLCPGELGASPLVTAAAAADALLPLMRALAPRLRELRLTRVFELECDLIPAVLAMESAGIAVDAAAFQRIVESWRRERQDAHDPARITRLDKLLTTFGHWPRDHVSLEGRIHTHLHPLATDTGRFASTAPNLQQVPAEHTAPGVRACFAAPPGRRLIVADYAQIELRVAAHLARCPVLRQVFVDGRDPHRTTAATLAGKPESAITDHERKLAKAVNFGFLFGMGARRFREYAAAGYGLDLDLPAAERARDAFLSTFPGIAAWHRQVGALARRGEREDIVVHTVLGRRRRFLAGAFSFTAALNVPVQGTAAEGFKLAMIDLHPALARLGGRGVLCVHDEYLAEVPEERADEAREVVQRTMEAAMSRVVPSLPIVAEARVAASWAEK